MKFYLPENKFENFLGIYSTIERTMLDKDEYIICIRGYGAISDSKLQKYISKSGGIMLKFIKHCDHKKKKSFNFGKALYITNKKKS